MNNPLSNLFLESDYILYMTSGLDKKPLQASIARATSAPVIENPTYFAINPIDPVINRNSKGQGTQRASINVTAFRNFLFEIDSLPLDKQLELLRSLAPKVPFAQVTFSGGSSYHAIVSVADTLPFKPHTVDGVAAYSRAWRALNAELMFHASNFLGPACPARIFDPSCKDPSRLSRTPLAIRPDTDTVQTPIDGFGGYLSSDDIQRLMHKHNFLETALAPKVEQCSEMDLRLFKTRLLYPENAGLRNKLVDVENWAGSENMYPVLFQLTLWIIDAVGAPLDTTLTFMRSDIFPAIKAARYPRNPEIAVHNAYIWKGLA